MGFALRMLYLWGSVSGYLVFLWIETILSFEMGLIFWQYSIFMGMGFRARAAHIPDSDSLVSGILAVSEATKAWGYTDYFHPDPGPPR